MSRRPSLGMDTILVSYSEAAKVIQPTNFEGRLILIFLSSLHLELMKNTRSPKIWAPIKGVFRIFLLDDVLRYLKLLSDLIVQLYNQNKS